MCTGLKHQESRAIRVNEPSRALWMSNGLREAAELPKLERGLYQSEASFCYTSQKLASRGNVFNPAPSL